MRRLRGRKALVTGAASGLGRSVALALAGEGTDLYLVDRRVEELAAVADEARRRGVEAFAEPCDLERPEEIDRIVAAVLRQWGGLHILVNNAAVAQYSTVRRLTAEDWRRTLQVNLLAPVQFVHQLLPVLREQEEAHILNVCSMMGLFAIRKLAAYQTSKWGLVGLTESLRADLRKTRVGATALCPGFLRTAMARAPSAGGEHAAPDWLCADPDAVARKAVRAIRRNRPLVVVTPLAKALWLLYRLSPRLFDLLRRYL